MPISNKPLFDLRGVYAHLHWAYNHPYALRSWTLDDWKRYIDFLAFLQVNLLQIWPMSSMLPLPLSDADRTYLKMYREVVEYAKSKYAMKVFVGECANNIAKPKVIDPIEKRDYFQTELLLNPSDPAHMETLRAHRAEMYQTIPNADGYWIIDSDPGGWHGSPAGEFVDILIMNRKLLNDVGRADAEIVYWMWQGWGTDDAKKNLETTIKDILRRLPEPWSILACSKDHLNLIKKMGLTNKTIYFPYGLVEPEPSPPYTHAPAVDIDKALFPIEEFAGIRGVMCNMQTPFVQLPRLHQFQQAALGNEIHLQEIAEMLFPENPEPLRNAWNAIEPTATSDETLKAAESLESAIAGGRLGHPGEAARLLPEQGLLIAKDLVLQLKIHAAARLSSELAKAGACGEAITNALRRFLGMVVAWHSRHGYTGRAGRDWPLLDFTDRADLDTAISTLVGKNSQSAKEAARNLADYVTYPDRKLTYRLAREIFFGAELS